MKMVRSTNYYDDLIKSFKKNPSDAAMYLEVVLEDGDPKMLQKALKNILESKGGMEKLSTSAKDCYTQVTQDLLDNGTSDIYLLANLLHELGFHLAVTVKSMNEIESDRASELCQV
jgi:DNA-binding phage protein